MAQIDGLASKSIYPSHLVPSGLSSSVSSQLPTMNPTQLSNPPFPYYTLADEGCPYILRGPAPQKTAHNPLDFELYRNVFNVEEQSIWAKFLLSILDEKTPPDSSKTKFNHHSSEDTLAPGFNLAETYDFETGPPHSSIIGHILHLGPNGQIESHLDNPCDSGPIILGLALGGPKIMHLLTDENHQEIAYKILLEPGSVYLQRHSVRYRLFHRFPKLDEFSGKLIGGSQRLSLILRDQILKPQK
ncbi:hypothetical protein DFH28DRAFT_959581 [Melampsora americana]|nr:hypothetical protein DFH28DRAFT_959581 [Melampsora americana]